MKTDGAIFVIGSFVVACSVEVDRLPTMGESLRARSFTLEAGGKGFNTAVAASRLGAEVDGVFAVGTDLFADFASEALAEVGLRAGMLHRFPGRTGAGVGFVDRQGENCIAVCAAANDFLSDREIAGAADRLARAGCVVAQFEVSDAPILAAFDLAKRQGITTVLNPSPFRAISPELLGLTDLIVVNRLEAEALAAQFALDGDDHDRLAASLAEAGVGGLVVTLGAEGAIGWAVSGEPRVQPAFAVEAVDTIGAGDAFLGALLAGIASGRDLAGCLRWGAACGAIVAGRSGVLDALPSLAELTAFLDRHEAPAGN